MADPDLTPSEVDALIALEKHRSNEDTHDFPIAGKSLSLPLQSIDGRERFFLDIERGRINLAKVKFQNRARHVFVLLRIDLAGAPHRNPDGEEIACPHLHRYRPGFGDKWAEPLPAQAFSNPGDYWQTLLDFYKYRNMTKPPLINSGLFNDK